MQVMTSRRLRLKRGFRILSQVFSQITLNLTRRLWKSNGIKALAARECVTRPAARKRVIPMPKNLVFPEVWKVQRPGAGPRQGRGFQARLRNLESFPGRPPGRRAAKPIRRPLSGAGRPEKQAAPEVFNPMRLLRHGTHETAGSMLRTLHAWTGRASKRYSQRVPGVCWNLTKPKAKISAAAARARSIGIHLEYAA